MIGAAECRERAAECRQMADGEQSSRVQSILMIRPRASTSPLPRLRSARTEISLCFHPTPFALSVA